jgi:multiple sugar transport system permease protein
MTALRRGRTNLWIELVLATAIIATVFPTAWIFWNSFKFSREIVNPIHPLSFTLFNYGDLFAGTSEFGHLFVNSLVLVVCTTLLCLGIGSLAAYSLSKYRWPRAFTLIVLAFVVFIQLIPPVALVPSYYVILNNLHLYNTIAGLVVVNAVFDLPFALLLLKVYFDTLPNELRDSALVDGCSAAGAFRRIMLPLAAPGFGAATILVAILTWNEFLMALSLTSTPDAQTITVGIASFIQQYSVRYGDMSAAAALATIPIIILAIFAHRYIVSGLTRGAVKG